MKKFAFLSFLLLTGIVITSFGAGHSVVLTWTPSPDGSANPTLAYNIFRGTAAGAEGSTPINAAPVAVGCSGAACTYTDTNVSVGQAYFYTVTAILNGVQSVPSNECNTTIPLGAPSGVSCKAN
jgi:hypothetical protein